MLMHTILQSDINKSPGKSRIIGTVLIILVALTLLTVMVGPSVAAVTQTTSALKAPGAGPKTTVVEPPIIWQHFYGDDDLFAKDVIQTSDGNFAVTGEFIFFSPGGLEGGAIFLLKAGADGEKLSQTFESHGFGRFYSGEFIQQMKDGSFIVAGSGTEILPSGSFFYLVKYDAAGNVLWSKTYRPEGGNSQLTAATATPDGGYLLVGNAIEPSGASYAYIVKTDALGNQQWDEIIYDTAGLGKSQAIPRAVTNAPGGYAITGEVLNEQTNLNTVFLLRINKLGKVITREHYEFSLPGASRTELDGASILYTKDGFVIAGRAYGYGLLGINAKAAFLLKTSVNGNIRWFKTYGQDTFSGATSIAQTNDGGYIVTGTTNFVTASSPIYAYIFRTDSNGNELWSKTIRRYTVSAGNKVKVTSDGGYIVAGMAVPGGSADTLLVRIAPDIVSRK